MQNLFSVMHECCPQQFRLETEKIGTDEEEKHKRESDERSTAGKI